MVADLTSLNLTNSADSHNCVGSKRSNDSGNFVNLLEVAKEQKEKNKQIWPEVKKMCTSYEGYASARCFYSDAVGGSESDIRAEYQDYMKSRGCSSDKELEILNRNFCDTKEEFINRVKPAIQAVASTLDYSSGISISNEQVDSMLSEASMQNMSTFYRAPASSFAERVSTFQTLLSNISQQDDASNSLKSSLGSLSQNITNASDSIIKCSDKIEAENAKSVRSFINSDFEKQKYNII